MNILLTSVGRRSYLVEYFKQAIGSQSKVVAANSEALTSGMISADKSYTVPSVDSDEYIPRLLEICQDNNIGLVVSLFDIDLPYLAKARAQFLKRGIEVAVSDPEVIDIANDKWQTYLFLTEKNIATPRTYLILNDALEDLGGSKIEFPVIVKPRWGMGSLSVFKADNGQELEFFYHYAIRQIEKSYLNILSRDDLAKSVLVQEFIPGKEYGLDVFNNLKGDHIQTIAKQKLAMRSGETDMSKVIENKQLNQIGENLSKVLRHRGNLDVDVLENTAGELFVLEMNARFGGGYPFSHLAGANFPRALVDMAMDRYIQPSKIQYGTVGLKSIQLLKS
ncbi:ATP-grasp domain-containing protein [Pseudidiomarina salilacus]|uniref:ATP-grasp domain-containing protein n=1 Tax=Pseudidiomarina salilacus TaxID=3384452 RepID=UPI003984F973